MSKRAKLSRGKKVAFDPEAHSHAALKAPGSKVVILDRHNVAGSIFQWTKTIAGVAGLTVFLTLLVYVGLSATLMTSVPSDDNFAERVWIARGTFTGGSAETGTMIYASATTPKPAGAVDKVLEGFIGAPDGLVAEVVAGPYGTVSSTPENSVVWEGEIIPGYSGTVRERLLNKEYLAECIQGSCTPGELILIPMGNVSGEAQATVSLTGIHSLGD